MINRIKQFLIIKLNKGRNRFILSLIFSVISSLKYFYPYYIHFDNITGFWIHQRGKYIICIDDVPNFSQSYSRMKKNTLNQYFKFYKPGFDDIIIDLGAGIGEDIFVINKYFGTNCRLYAIEAHPVTFNKLKLMIEMNYFSNVHCSNCAIVESPKKIFINDTDNHSSNRINNFQFGYEIDGLTMDEFIEKQNLNKIDLLKINIEGAEKGVLLGMSKNIKNVLNIVIACHDKLAKYYNDDPFFLTRDFVHQYLLNHDFIIDAEVETLYHTTFYAHHK